MPANPSSGPNYHKQVLILILGLTLIRIIGLVISPLNLHGDEAQYWSWSRTFDWGYFSKPPMIAWLIGATTSVFGNAEWAVRLSTPLIHPLTAYVLFRTGRFLFDARTGFWAACLYFLMPAVWLSSGIVSTDVPLLLCWAVALNALVHLRESRNIRWAVMLGAAIGFGMLSKYAMVFFLLALGLCILLDPKSRRALLSRAGLLVIVIATLILSPNLAWNAANDFATLNHTAANANIKGVPFHPFELLEFMGSQFGVFGPVTMVLLVLACLAALRGKLGQDALLLSLFVLAPLAVITLEALLSRANANWAVSAYVSASLLGAHFGLKAFERAMKAGIGLNIFLGLILTLGGLVPAFANQVGQANAFKRMRGWPETKLAVQQAVERGHDGRAFTALAVDNRLVFYDLLYYGIEKDTALPLRIWLHTAYIDNHAEATAALAASNLADGPVLIVNYYSDYEDELLDDFVRLDKLPPLEIDLGGGKIRRLRLWAGYGYTPTKKLDR